MSFGAEVADWSDKADAGANEWVRGVVTDLASELVFTTPIGMPDTWVRHRAPPGYAPGTLRAGWHYSSRGPVQRLPEAPDADGQATLAAMVAEMPARMAGKIHYLSNNVPYFPLIEYAGYSKQAPGGVIGPAVLKFQAIANRSGLTVFGGEQ